MRTARTIAHEAKKSMGGVGLRELSESIGVQTPYLSEVSRGLKPIGRTETFARFAAENDMSGDEIKASLREWWPDFPWDQTDQAA